MSLATRQFWKVVLILSLVPVASPWISPAAAGDRDFQGYYSTRLQSRVNVTNAELRKNLKRYRKDRGVWRLDECYRVIVHQADEIEVYLASAVKHLSEVPLTEEDAKLKAQVDKLEVITIRDSEVPFLCDRLYDVGQLYMKRDKGKAKDSFRAITNKFGACDGCRGKAEAALERLR